MCYFKVFLPVPDRAVGALPHLLQVELLDPGLVGRDGRALDADVVQRNRLGGVKGDLEWKRREKKKKKNYINIRKGFASHSACKIQW